MGLKKTSSGKTAVPSARLQNMQKFLRVLFGRKIVIAGAIVVVSMLLVALFAPFAAPYDPYQLNLAESLQDPSLRHLLGTDSVGRDVLSRLIYGSQVSILVGLVSVLIAGGIGMVLGLIAGTLGRGADAVIMRCMDAMLALPLLILALFIAAALGAGLTNVIISVGIALIPSYARLTRAQVLAVKELDYVTAGTISGATNFKNIIVHILPNCLSPIIVLMTTNLGIAILAEAGLSFLGLGIAPPTASWGSMILEGYNVLRVKPVLSIAPGCAIIAVVMAFNIVGDALRDALDPRLRGTFETVGKSR
jgi:peptide/nickel transport system permease protein